MPSSNFAGKRSYNKNKNTQKKVDRKYDINQELIARLKSVPKYGKNNIPDMQQKLPQIEFEEKYAMLLEPDIHTQK
jgi:hypothetical protein